MTPNIRIRGLVKGIVGLVVIVGLVYVLFWLNAREFSFIRWLVVLVALPGAYGLAGFIEFISGIPFRELSKRWAGLAGRQRGVLGVSIVILVLVLLIVVISLWDFMGL
ncbi:MAG: hypothetical protein EHM45_08635 [Desulfobacteraceae bacterium]|nr:MAG: hypothetical protein EHM45_08635 [Desulfobacteraceae bacterium]